jgi:hypothetical protein
MAQARGRLHGVLWPTPYGGEGMKDLILRLLGIHTCSMCVRFSEYNNEGIISWQVDEGIVCGKPGDMSGHTCFTAKKMNECVDWLAGHYPEEFRIKD